LTGRFGLREDVCRRVLRALVETRNILQVADGVYVRRDVWTHGQGFIRSRTLRA